MHYFQSCWSSGQCWGSYFLKVICYSYKLRAEKMNLLQLLCYFFTDVTCYSYKLLKKVTCYFSVTFDRPANCLFMFRRPYNRNTVLYIQQARNQGGGVLGGS